MPFLFAVIPSLASGDDLKPGAEVPVRLKEIRNPAEVIVSYQGRDIDVTLTGVREMSQEMHQAMETRKRLPGVIGAENQNLVLKVDAAERDGKLPGQLYRYLPMEKDDARKRLTDFYLAGSPATHMRWFGINLNLQLLELGLAGYDEASCEGSEDLFRAKIGEIKKKRTASPTE